MKIYYFTVLSFLIFTPAICFGQTNNFQQLEFLIGKWNGTGSGFGNETSIIKSSFKPLMNDKYVEFSIESWFEPTTNNPDDEHHIDHGYISYDNERDLIVIRQFHVEGYVIQYLLVDSLSKDLMLVFESESIENFVPGGKAHRTIKKVLKKQVETIFDVAFPNSKGKIVKRAGDFL